MLKHRPGKVLFLFLMGGSHQPGTAACVCISPQRFAGPPHVPLTTRRYRLRASCASLSTLDDSPNRRWTQHNRWTPPPLRSRASFGAALSYPVLKFSLLTALPFFCCRFAALKMFFTAFRACSCCVRPNLLSTQYTCSTSLDSGAPLWCVFQCPAVLCPQVSFPAPHCDVSFSFQGAYLTGRGVPGSGGVEIGKVQLMLKARPLQGMRVDPVTGARKKVRRYSSTKDRKRCPTEDKRKKCAAESQR